MSDQAGETFFDDARRRVTVAKLVKSGGAGSVYLLRESPQLVAKLYHPTVDHATYARKVAAMLRLSPDLPDLVDGGRRMVQIAWPTSLLHDRHGRFAGFLMPAVDVQATSELELILQEKQARASGLPIGLGPKVTLAANLAAVVAALHARHHYIVDLKPVNLRFYRQSLHMAMLDCDGLSIQGEGERFPAPQFTPDYLAPEFQRSGITTDGEQAQDRFALAVVIFQLLNFGIHPYTGRPSASNVPTDIPGRIAGRWYAYGAGGNTGIAPNPGSGHGRMPSELRAMFDRAFESRGHGRPAPHEWQALLESFARRSTGRVVVCAHDAVHQHYAGQECAHCERVQLLRKARTAKPARSPTVTTAHVRRPTARAKARRASATQPLPPHPPAPYMPKPLPPPKPLGPVALFFVRKLQQLAFVALFLVALMVVLRLFGPVETPVAHAPEPARPAPALESPYIPPLDVVVGPTEWIYAYVGNAAVQDSDLAALVDALRTRDAQMPPATTQILAAFDAAILAYDVTPEVRRREARRQLRVQLEKLLLADPHASDIAFELGWMSLLDVDRENAQRYFKHAISASPANPAGWYGLGVLDSNASFGALSLAEALATDAWKARALRQRFPPAMLSILGFDADRFTIVQARARVRAGPITQLPVPPEVASLAKQPLPQ
jgi:hypothetical protein